MSAKIFTLFWVTTLLGFQPALFAQSSKLSKKLLKTENLVALWDFHESEGQVRASLKGDFELAEMHGSVPRILEGPLSGFSAQFGSGAYLSLANEKTGALNIFGPKQGVTVMAWVKWTGEQTGFVGGMWNEYQDGGKRQYGLFVSLPHFNGKNQVCGHISWNGKPTPPFPYSSDYSASAQEVPANTWVYIAFTYDGTYIRSYMNGKFIAREKELILNTTGFEGYPNGLIQSKNPYYYPLGMGNNGSDFTVGAVLLKRGMGNFFKGQIAGLAVFNRALKESEIGRLGE